MATVYLTYDQYKQYGGQLSEGEFALLELRCRKRIDYLTDCRVRAMAEVDRVPEAVRACMFALVGMESKVGASAQVSSPVVTSFTTDGYTEQHGNLPNASEAEEQMTRLIRQYLYGEYDLYGIPLLYRGVYP